MASGNRSVNKGSNCPFGCQYRQPASYASDVKIGKAMMYLISMLTDRNWIRFLLDNFKTKLKIIQNQFPKKQYLVLGIFLILTTLFLGGCSFITPGTSQAEKILKDKYGEEFIVTRMDKNSVFSDYYTVIAYSEEYPNLLFKASIEQETKEISDSYVSKRVCSRMADTISQNIIGISDNYYVFVEAMLGDTLFEDPEVSLEEYLEEYPASRFSIYLCIEDNGSLDSENIVSIARHLLDNLPEINGSLPIYITDGETMEYIQNYVNSNVTTYTDFDRATEDAYVGSIDINNSKFSITENWLEENYFAKSEE